MAAQLKIVGPLIIVWAGGFWILAAVALRGRVGELLLDPSYASGGAWYVGAVSQLGVLAWSVGTVAAAGGSWVLRRTNRLDAARFLARGAYVGAILLLDDLFGLHSGPLSDLGLPKPVAMLVLGAPIAAWLMVHRADIWRTRWQVLACSFLGLGTSVLVDVALSPGRLDLALLYEDGPKFLASLAWATYFVITTKDIIDSAIDSAMSSATHRKIAGEGEARADLTVSQSTPTSP
jgi:hypothetical protein